MLRDFREDGSGSAIEADLCIIGGGPAGIAIAREFNGTRHTVVLLESGGLKFDRDIQALHRGTNEGGHFSLHRSRFRMLGGTSYVWGGWSAPFDDIDFRVRPWVAHSGWPIARDMLLPYYERAQPLCELGPFRYRVSEWTETAADALVLDANKLEHKLWQISPQTHFGNTYAGELEAAPNITVLLYATATEIVTTENAAAVSEVRFATLGGRRGTVRARAYIIAGGGIETARLLLASNRIESAGLANRHDVVGRYFMEHPHADAGSVYLFKDATALRPYFERKAGDPQLVVGLGPSERAQRRLEILNSSVAIRGPLHFEPSEGWDSLIKLSRAAGDRRWPDSAGTHVFNILRDLDDVLREGFRRSRGKEIQGFSLLARTETEPNPANRVILDRERDALGMPRVRLQWSASRLDRVTVEKTMMLVAEEFGRFGIGRVRLNELLLADDQRWTGNLSWYGHHMGTTRMSTDPRSGVVDPDCRVHDIDNLYVASSSVFPTAGYANPTLTILALALRLADHVRTKVLA